MNIATLNRIIFLWAFWDLTVVAYCAPEYVEAVVAFVGEKVITTSEIKRMTAEAEKGYYATLKGAELEKAVNDIHTRALEHIIDSELIYMDFKALKGNVPPRYVQERIDEIVVQQSNGDEEAFRDILHSQQVTWQEFKERIHKQVAVEMLTYDRTRRNLQVSDLEVEQYYKEHLSDYNQERECRLQVIALKKNGRHLGNLAVVVKKIQDHVANGGSFAEMVQQYSELPNATTNLGMMEWQKEQSLAAPLALAVKMMKKGEVLQKPIPLGSSLYIIRLADVRGGNNRPLDDALRTSIRKILAEKIAKERYDAYIRTLYIKFPVKRFDR